MSLKSILRVVRLAFAPARTARADEADLFCITVTSSERVGHHQHSAVRRPSQSEDGSFIGGMRKTGAVQFHRLNVVPIRVPPLRERADDIPLLVAHFVRQLTARHG